MGMPTWLVLGQFALASRRSHADALLGLAEALEDAARAPPLLAAGIAIGAVPAPGPLPEAQAAPLRREALALAGGLRRRAAEPA